MDLPRELTYKHVRRFNEPGHAHFLTFSCMDRRPLLSADAWCVWLGQSVRHACDAMDYQLWAYVFMPEHVHLLVRPRREAYDISAFLKKVKQPVATRIVNVLKKDRSPVLADLRVDDAGQGVHYRFWLPGGGHDFNVKSMDKALEKAQYCHRNPVIRGLVENEADWRWSSYRWLE